MTVEATELSARMREAARSLSQPTNLDETLARITSTARVAIPGADYVSLSVRRQDGTLETKAATDSLIERLDSIQYELREGPCGSRTSHTPRPG